MDQKLLMRIVVATLCIVLLSGPSTLFSVAQVTDTHSLDSDSDGISDWDETNRYWSDPYSRDSDGDGIDDLREVQTGTSPIDTDSDGDHLSDGYEYSVWNPLAPSVEDKYYRCPYIADLPTISFDIPDTEDNVIRHYYFQKGSEARNATVTGISKHTRINDGWGTRNKNIQSVTGGHDLWVGLKSVNTLDIELAALGAGSKVKVYLPQPYLQLGGWQKGTYGFDNSQFWDYSRTDIDVDGRQDQNITSEFQQEGWDLASATFLANITVSNNYDRTYRLDSLVFDLTSNGRVYRSVDWSFSPVVMGVGEKHTFMATFEISGEEWIRDILWSKTRIEINMTSFEASLYSDTEGWISHDVIQEDVTSRCVKVEIDVDDGVVLEKYVTAVVDKIDGLNAIDALDRLFLSYDFKYGRLLSLLGMKSQTNKMVWTFQYSEHYYEVMASRVDELNFEKVRMWGRGFLLLNMERDSDGDWLPDSVDPYPQTRDYDNDYADDYVEIVQMKSFPYLPDSDGGGTIDGIEFFEGLDALDPNDDLLDYPDWYTNHITMSTASSAAEYLLEQGVRPTTDQLTWAAPSTEPTLTPLDFTGEVSYAANRTLFDGYDDSVLCIDTGDVDSDGTNEIVIGTAPSGCVVVLDNETGSWVGEVIANLSRYYNDSQVRVYDLKIGDADNDGEPEIVVGSWHEDGGEVGDLFEYYMFGGEWHNSSINTATIPGGVYSVDIGDVYANENNQVVMGQGGDSQGNVTAYTKSGSSWSSETVTSLGSEWVDVLIGDFGSTGQNKIVYCSYSLNSTLGFAEYDTTYSEWDTTTIDTRTVYAGDPPPYVRYMRVQLGDPESTGTMNLIVAVDHSSANSDSIEMWGYPASGPVTLFSGLDFSGPQFVVSDIDNNGVSDICWHNLDPFTYPNNELTVGLYNNTSSSYYTHKIENVTVPYVPSIAAGDYDTDGEVELLYSTETGGQVRAWDHPAGYLWPSEKLEWTIHLNLGPTSFYEDEDFPIDVLVENLGDNTIRTLDVSVELPPLVTNITQSEYEVPVLKSGDSASGNFVLRAVTSGEYLVTVQATSNDPCVSFEYPIHLTVRPRDALQAGIGSALLLLAEETGNLTLLEEANRLGNWLHENKIEINTSAVWNSDANKTDEARPGHIISTVRTGEFFLDLHHATGDVRFLSDALLAARYLRNSILPEGAWSLHANGIAEAAIAGQFLLKCDRAIRSDYFQSTVDKVVTYLLAHSTSTPSGRCWLDSFGLTMEVNAFLLSASLGTGDTGWSWLVSQAQNATWMAGLYPAVRPDDYASHFVGVGLAGVIDTLAVIEQSGHSAASELIQAANLMVSQAVNTGQGLNWIQPTWTTNVSKLARSIGWDYGASGAASALARAYQITGHQAYLDCALDAVTWLESSIEEISVSPDSSETEYEALADSILALVRIHATLPVVSVGYFVDPMTSLEGGSFVVTGYVQTSGWHARNVNITVHLPGTMLLEGGQTETIDLGDIAQPSVVLAQWEVSFIPTSDPSLLYGTYDLDISALSNNGGSDSSSASVIVTDIGVTKVEESEQPLMHTMLSVAQEVQTELYSVAEDVLIPIRVEYSDGEPAVNASVTVGDYGRGIVNESGYAYFPVTSFEPGTVEFPVSLEYDKKSGITSGAQNTTVSLTFTNLEIYDVVVDRLSAGVGESITIHGKVRYSHDHSIAPGAVVYVNNETYTTADQEGVFTLTYTGESEGVETINVYAVFDGNGKTFIPTTWVELEITWTSFWTPLNTALVLSGGVGVAAVVALVVVRKRRTSDTP